MCRELGQQSERIERLLPRQESPSRVGRVEPVDDPGAVHARTWWSVYHFFGSASGEGFAIERESDRAPAPARRALA